MKIRKILFNIYILIAISIEINAQIVSNDESDYRIDSRSLSPEAFQFSKYGNTPTRNFHGELDLSIPLYVYKDRDFEIPISLTYNNDGFKPNEHEGIIGLGWNLNVGGAITRKVEGGVPDETWDGTVAGMIGATEKNIYKYSIDFNQKIKQSEIYNNNYSQDLIVNYNFLVSHRNPNLKSYAGELGPDLFTFYMPGHTGQFNISWDGTIKTTGGNNYRVDLSHFVYSQMIIITDPNGYKYTFGGNKNATESSIFFPDQKNINNYKEITTTWLLTKITAPNGRSMTFIYKNLNKDTHTKGNNDLILKSTLPEFGSVDLNQDSENLQITGASLFDKSSYKYELIRQNYIERIEIDNISINFEYVEKENTFYIQENNNIFHSYFLEKNLKLKTINVLVGPKQVRTIDFQQKYLGNENKRFFLTNVIRDSNEKFSFEYYNTNRIPRPDPNLIDHWGYYNGTKNIQYGLAPEKMILTGTGIISLPKFDSLKPLSRQPDEESCKVGMIKQIKYPTGGYSQFHFELHKDIDYELHKSTYGAEALYKDKVLGFSAMKVIGGLRIKRIEDFDILGNSSNQRDFSYPVGILTHFPYYLRERALLVSTKGVNGYFYVTLYTMPTKRKNYPTDKHIQYAEVVEKDKRGSHIYKYTSYIETENRDLYHTSLPYFYYFPSDHSTWFNYPHGVDLRGTDRSYRRGLLKEEIVLNAEQDTILKKSNKYDFYPKTLGETMAIDQGLLITNKYSIENALARLVERTETSYFKDYSISKKQKQEYNENGVLIKEIDVDNNIINSYLYPYDKSGYPYEDMVNLNILSPIVEKETIRNNKSLKKMITEYLGFNNNKLFLPSKLYSVLNSGTPSLDIEFKKYDEYGNPVLTIEKDRSSNIYLWGFRGKHLIAEIKNTNNENMVIALKGKYPEQLSSLPIPDTLLLKSLYKDTILSDALIKSFYYEPLIGVVKTTDPQNIDTYYRYDQFNRLETIYRKDSIYQEKIETYNYHLLENTYITSSFRILGKGNVYIKDICQFSIETAENSTDYMYEWSVVNSQGKVINRTDNMNETVFKTFFEDLGEYFIYCKITNKNTGFNKQLSHKINIIEPPIEFSNFQRFNVYPQSAGSQADIICYKPTTIVLNFYFNKTGSSNIHHATFSINGQSYTRYDNGNQKITLTLPIGINKCYLNVYKTVNTGSCNASIIIEKVQNNTIGTTSSMSNGI